MFELALAELGECLPVGLGVGFGYSKQSSRWFWRVRTMFRRLRPVEQPVQLKQHVVYGSARALPLFLSVPYGTSFHFLRPILNWEAYLIRLCL